MKGNGNKVTKAKVGLMENKMMAVITIIKTSELPHARLHFGTKGTLLLGEGMADAYLKNRSGQRNSGE